jgi:hypothetical protein
MVGTSWNRRARATRRSNRHCRLQEMLHAMPTDHAPELAALAKRLADAKEFL